MAIDSALKRRRALRSTFKDEGPTHILPSGAVTAIDRYQRGGFYFTESDPIVVGSKIRFTASDATYIEIEPPLWGYETEIRLPFYKSTRADNTVQVFDAGAQFDKRICNCTFEVNETDALSIMNFFTTNTLGRGNTVTLSLPAISPWSGSRWFPFGPDYGDYGNYSVQVVALQRSEQLTEPFRWYRIGMKILYMGGPTPKWTTVAGTDYGNITISGISNIRFPMDGGLQATRDIALSVDMAVSAASSFVNYGAGVDGYDTKMNIDATRLKMEELIKYITVTNRNPATKLLPTMTIGTNVNQFLFGPEIGDSRSDTVLLLNSVLKIVHVNYDQFKTEFQFHYVPGI